MLWENKIDFSLQWGITTILSFLNLLSQIHPCMMKLNCTFFGIFKNDWKLGDPGYETAWMRHLELLMK